MSVAGSHALLLTEDGFFVVCLFGRIGISGETKMDIGSFQPPRRGRRTNPAVKAVTASR